MEDSQLVAPRVDTTPLAFDQPRGDSVKGGDSVSEAKKKSVNDIPTGSVNESIAGSVNNPTTGNEVKEAPTNQLSLNTLEKQSTDVLEKSSECGERAAEESKLFGTGPDHCSHLAGAGEAAAGSVAGSSLSGDGASSCLSRDESTRRTDEVDDLLGNRTAQWETCGEDRPDGGGEEEYSRVANGTGQ